MCLVLIACYTAACNLSFADPSNAIITPIKASDELEEAIHLAVLQRLWSSHGEKDTEGHCILLVETDKDGLTVVYAIASYASYGFENDVFTIKSGSWAIPAVIKFNKRDDGYTLLSYTEAADGDNYTSSIKELFPRQLWTSVSGARTYSAELENQQVQQAKTYLKAIGRNAKVSAGYVEKESFHISEEASNTLFGLLELSDYPFFIGTQKFVKDGIRYAYVACEEDFSDYVILTFTKRNAAGMPLHRLKYRITGDDVSQLEQ